MVHLKASLSTVFIIAVSSYYAFGLAPNTAPLKHHNETIEQYPQTVFRFINDSSPRSIRGAFLAKNTAKQKQFETSGDEKPSKVLTNPRFAHSKSSHIRFDPKLYYCTDWNKADCKNKTEQFKEKILFEFKKASLDIPNEANIYHVSYQARPTFLPSYCLVLNAEVKTLQGDMPPFNTNLLGSLLPCKKLLYKHTKANQKPTCIIVSSAGSAKGSGMGDFIGERKYKLINNQR